MSHNLSQDVVVTVSIPLITALAGAAVVALRAPFAGTVEGITAAVSAAFTATDIVIAGRIDANAITSGSITLATAGSGFGTSGTASPSAAKTFTAGQVINATVTGGVGAGVNGSIVFVLRRS